MGLRGSPSACLGVSGRGLGGCFDAQARGSPSNVSARVLISVHFCCLKYPPASSRPKKLVINSILLVFNMVSSGPPSLGFPPSFPCRCRFLRMSQLACSFLLICVECLSSRAHFCCRCSFLRMSQLACSFLLICVECLRRWVQFQKRRMSQLPCSFLLICVECLSSRAHFRWRCKFLRMS